MSIFLKDQRLENSLFQPLESIVGCKVTDPHNAQYYVQSELKEITMAFTASDVIPLTQARATLSELVEQVKAGAEKIITKNGESYVAIIDAKRLDYYHQLERERIHLLLIDDASKGLGDIAAGKVKDARSTLAALKRRRAAKAPA